MPAGADLTRRQVAFFALNAGRNRRLRAVPAAPASPAVPVGVAADPNCWAAPRAWVAAIALAGTASVSSATAAASARMSLRKFMIPVLLLDAW